MPEDKGDIFSDNRAEREQAHRLREQAQKGGLYFEAYLPGDMAVWLLKLVENGDFVDPSHAVFEIVRTYMELEPHHDLRKKLLRRSIERAMEDVETGRVYSSEEVVERLERRMAEPLPEPARWAKIKR